MLALFPLSKMVGTHFRPDVVSEKSVGPCLRLSIFDGKPLMLLKLHTNAGEAEIRHKGTAEGMRARDSGSIHLTIDADSSSGLASRA